MPDAATRRRSSLSAAALCLLLQTGGAHGQVLAQLEPPSTPATPAAPAAAASPAGGEGLGAQLTELQRMLSAMTAAETARQADAAKLHEQLTQLRAQVEWHERALPWLTVVIALLACAVSVLAAAVWRRRSSPLRAPLAPAVTPPVTRPPRGGTAATEVERTAPQPGEVTATRASRPLPAEPAPSPFERSLPDRPEFVSSTRPVPQLFTTPAQQPPALTAEALIDLEQQADFFLALGQDEAAVERLLAELRLVEGRSPMPWLKLLQIHRRQDDVAAYQRALERFRQRFAAEGAEWAEPDLITRGLEDTPGVTSALQRAWAADPRQAMTLLERLVGGCEQGVLLSLPASQDALLLYQLARSYLPDAPAEHATDIDLLLPMDAAAQRQAIAQRGRLDVDLSSSYAPLGKP